MICKETETFMDGYLDGELDLVRSIELERHLRDCPLCAQFHKDRITLHASMRAGSLRYQAPEALRKSVHAALAAADRKVRKPERKWFHVQWPAIAATAAAVILVVALWMRPADRLLEREVVASHVRSLMAGHLTDVASSDRHTVKPWFAGKVDFSPPVKDFAEEGFRLVGGRLDYLDDHAVAALVYQRREHIINVFVWPVASGDRAARASVSQGYNVIELVRSGTAYWLVGDLNRTELEQFAERLTVP